MNYSSYRQAIDAMSMYANSPSRPNLGINLGSAVDTVPIWGDATYLRSPSIMAARGGFWYQHRGQYQARNSDVMVVASEEDKELGNTTLIGGGHEVVILPGTRHPREVISAGSVEMACAPIKLAPEHAARLYPLITPWSLYQLACNPQRRDLAPSLEDFMYDCPVRNEQHSLKKIIEAQFARSLAAGITPDAHQWETLQYCLTGDDTYIADDAGLGKTLSVILYMLLHRPLRTLIICPSSAKHNWADELQRFCSDAQVTQINVLDAPLPNPVNGTLTHGMMHTLLGSQDMAATVTIINYDNLHKLLPALHDTTFDLLVCDEAKRLQYDDSNRTAMVLGGTPGKAKYVNGRKVGYKAISALKRIFCDGTPLDKPRQLWPIFRAFDRNGLGADKIEYQNKYCGAYTDDFGNYQVEGNVKREVVAALGHEARKRFMIRHSDEVLGITEPTEEVVFLPLSEEARDELVNEEQSAILNALATLEQKDPDQANALRRAILKESKVAGEAEAMRNVIGTTFAEQLSSGGARGPMTKILLEEMASVRRRVGVAKVTPSAEYIFLHWLANDCKPVLIFAYHKDVVSKLQLALVDMYLDHRDGAKPGMTNKYEDAGATVADTITGATASKAKGMIKNAFQAGKTAFLICNIAAAGEALTLTAASDVFFVEADWSARAIRQAWKRAHRRGQTASVRVYMLYLDRTFDYTVTTKFLYKRTIQDAFFDENNDDDE